MEISSVEIGSKLVVLFEVKTKLVIPHSIRNDSKVWIRSENAKHFRITPPMESHSD
jgi:hypothetical protein